MKKIFYTTIITMLLLLQTSCYHRIGDLSVVGNRNMDTKTDYCLLKTYVTGKGKSKTGDGMEVAVDNAVRSVSGGEYMKNVTIFSKREGRSIKVIGDVWGHCPNGQQSNTSNNVNTSTSNNNNQPVYNTPDTPEIAVGDKVSFKYFGRYFIGTVIGLKAKTALVRFVGYEDQEGIREFKYEKLTVVADI